MKVVGSLHANFLSGMQWSVLVRNVTGADDPLSSVNRSKPPLVSVAEPFGRDIINDIESCSDF